MILVVGGSGDLGSRIVRRLRDGGREVRCLVRPETDAATLRELGPQPGNRPIRMGLHLQHEPLTRAAPSHVDHVHARHVEQGVDARAVASGHSAARRRLSHRRGPSVGSLVAPDPEGPRPISPRATRLPAYSPTENSEEPDKGVRAPDRDAFRVGGGRGGCGHGWLPDRRSGGRCSRVLGSCWVRRLSQSATLPLGSHR